MISFAMYIIAAAVIVFFVLFVISMAAQGFCFILHVVVYIVTLGRVNLKKHFDEQMAIQKAEKVARQQQLVNEATQRMQYKKEAQRVLVIAFLALSIMDANAQRLSPVALIRHEYTINLDHIPAHTGHPLPKNGVWTSRPLHVDDKEFLHMVCDQPNASCSEVTYKVSAYMVPELVIMCVWYLVQSNQDSSVFKMNDNARFYFSHVRDAN